MLNGRMNGVRKAIQIAKLYVRRKLLLMKTALTW